MYSHLKSKYVNLKKKLFSHFHQGISCIQIRLYKLSFLVVLPISRPTICEKVIDEQGGILEPREDDTITMVIPAGALTGAQLVSIQVSAFGQIGELLHN
jgi:hypothetical protein